MEYTASIICMCWFFIVLQIEPYELHLLDKWSSMELHPHSLDFKTGSQCIAWGWHCLHDLTASASHYRHAPPSLAVVTLTEFTPKGRHRFTFVIRYYLLMQNNSTTVAFV